MPIRRVALGVLIHSLALLLCLAPTAAPAQGLHAADYAGLLVVLSQLKQNLDSVTNTVDLETANRINQIKVSLDAVIKEVNDTIQGIADKTVVTETKIFGDVNDVMNQTNEELEKKGYLVFVGTNSTLVNMATVLEGIPFVKVKPYLFASSPLRLSPKASDRQVAFYGHFPDVDSSHPATVLVEMEGVGKKQVTLQKSIGNQLTFIVPGEYVKEGRFIEMTVSIPVVKFYVWHTTDDTHARLYVEKSNTFSFENQAFRENPDLWDTIQSPREHNEHADSNRTTNAATLTAPQLFSY